MIFTPKEANPAAAIVYRVSRMQQHEPSNLIIPAPPFCSEPNVHKEYASRRPRIWKLQSQLPANCYG